MKGSHVLGQLSTHKHYRRQRPSMCACARPTCWRRSSSHVGGDEAQSKRRVPMTGGRKPGTTTLCSEPGVTLGPVRRQTCLHEHAEDHVRDSQAADHVRDLSRAHHERGAPGLYRQPRRGYFEGDEWPVVFGAHLTRC